MVERSLDLERPADALDAAASFVIRVLAAKEEDGTKGETRVVEEEDCLGR